MKRLDPCLRITGAGGETVGLVGESMAYNQLFSLPVGEVSCIIVSPLVTFTREECDEKMQLYNPIFGKFYENVSVRTQGAA